MPLDVPPPRKSRSGSPLVLSRVVHWVRPELVVEVKFLTWTEDGLLRQVSTRAFAKTSGLWMFGDHPSQIGCDRDPIDTRRAASSGALRALGHDGKRRNFP